MVVWSNCRNTARAIVTGPLRLSAPERAPETSLGPEQDMLTPPTDPGCCTAPRPATHSVLLQSIVSAGRLTRRDSLPAMLTSQALDWPGVLLEAGKNDVAAVDDVVGDRHYLSLNVDTKPLTLTLRDEADSRNRGGLAVVEAVTTALGHLLVRHAGVERVQPLRARGGLSGVAKRRALELIDARLDARLTVDMLAREVGLSPAHFARAFKETVGRAPHQYLLWLRLERARRLLELCDADLSDIAQRTGFADQAHFTRLFKRAYGITPGALTRHWQC